MLQYNLTDLKDYLRISIDFTDHDHLLEKLFKYVMADVQKTIGFDLSVTTYTNEIHNLLWFQRSFQTKVFPLIAPETGNILTITINGSALNLDDILYDLQGNISFKNICNLNNGYDMNQILVSYDAGYAEFPADVEGVIFEFIKGLYDGSTNIQEIKDLSSDVIKFPNIGSYPAHIYRILNNYRRGGY